MESPHHLNAKVNFFKYLNDEYSLASLGDPKILTTDPTRRQNFTYFHRLSGVVMLHQLMDLDLSNVSRNFLRVGELIQPYPRVSNQWCGDIADYSNLVGRNETIVSDEQPRELLEIGRRLSDAIIEADTLPSGIAGRILTNSQFLPLAMRLAFIYSYLKYQAHKEVGFNKTQLWYSSELNPDAREDLWYSLEDETQYFTSYPPINPAELPTRDKVFFMGTYVDFKSIEPFLSELGVEDPEKLEICRSMGSFWSRFLGSENFLDEPISKPREVIASGNIRAYPGGSGMTFRVSDHWFFNLADSFGINVRRVDTNELIQREQ